MLISYVLRLRPDALAQGRFVGEIEAVTTRDRAAIRSVDQMMAYVLEAASGQVERAGRALAQQDAAPLPPIPLGTRR